MLLNRANTVIWTFTLFKSFVPNYTNTFTVCSPLWAMQHWDFPSLYWCIFPLSLLLGHFWSLSIDLLHNTGIQTCMLNKSYLRCCLDQREWQMLRQQCASSFPAAFFSFEQPFPQEWEQAGVLHWSLSQYVRIKKKGHWGSH